LLYFILFSKKHLQKYKKIGKPYLRLGIFRIFVQKETLFLHKDKLFSLKIEKRKEKNI
jgi:hypothetical protein